DLLLIVERLVAKHENGVLVHAGFDRLDRIARQRFRDVDAGYRADEARVKPTDADRHCSSPVNRVCRRVSVPGRPARPGRSSVHATLQPGASEKLTRRMTAP